MATTRYVYAGGGQLVSEDRGGDRRFYRNDGRGSTSQLFDDSGAITDSYQYTYFGKTSHTGSSVTPFQWRANSQTYSESSDLQFGNFGYGRVPSPWISGWIQPWDPGPGITIGEWPRPLPQIDIGDIIGGFWPGIIIVVTPGNPPSPPRPRPPRPTPPTPSPGLPTPAPVADCAVDENLDPCNRPAGRDQGVLILKLSACAAKCGLDTLAPPCFALIEEGVSWSTIIGCIGDLLDKSIINLAGLIRCLADCYFDNQDAFDPGPFPWQFCSSTGKGSGTCEECCERTARGPSKTDCYDCCTREAGPPTGNGTLTTR